MLIRPANPVAAAQGARHIVVVQRSDYGKHYRDFIDGARRHGATSEREGEEIFWIVFEGDPKKVVSSVNHEWITRCLWEKMRSFELVN